MLELVVGVQQENELNFAGLGKIAQFVDLCRRIGTLKGELFRYGPDFKLRERVNLGSFGVVALGSDQEGGLWAATEGDLIRMSLPSPWSFIGAAQGLGGLLPQYPTYCVGHIRLTTPIGADDCRHPRQKIQ